MSDPAAPKGAPTSTERVKLDVVAYYPFAASTKGKGEVSGRVLFGGTGDQSGEEILKKFTAEQLAESIVVIDMPLAGGGVRGTVKYYPGSFPDPLPEPVKAPRVASQGGRGPMAALEGKCKGIIFCYTDVSDEAARHNYLPFSDQHRKIPALWVGRQGSDLSQIGFGQGDGHHAVRREADAGCAGGLAARRAEGRDGRGHLHDHAHRRAERGQRQWRARPAGGGDVPVEDSRTAGGRSCSRCRRATMRAARSAMR